LKKRIGVIMYQTSKTKGQELVAERMVWYFRRMGHEAYLITSVYHDGEEVISESSLGEDGYILIDDAELQIPVIRVGSITSKWPHRRVLFQDSIYTLEKIVNRFKLNVLITHSTLWNGPEDVAKFVEWRRNVKESGGYEDPLIFCHMSHFQEPSRKRYSLVERSFRMAWNRLALKTVLSVANLVLVVTPFEQQSKVSLGAKPEKCILFPGGVDDQGFLRYAIIDRRDLYNKLGLDLSVKFVSYLGTIEERKNTKTILNVAEKLRERNDVHFVIAGNGESEYARQVKEWAETLPNVTYLGKIDEKQKVQLIEVSYLNILLSRMEALGLAQLEFMFKGVPVITSGVGGQSWVVRNGQDGLHVNGPDDVEGAVNAITQLVEDEVRWKKLSENSRTRAEDFTLTRLVKELDEALTHELEKESGLSALTPEVRSTLTEPELVIGSWSHGGRKVVATSQRIFIQKGRMSRSTVEVPYSTINSIEYVRHYWWAALVIGAILSGLILTGPFSVPLLINELRIMLPVAESNLRLLLAVGIAPLVIGAALFGISLRKGYALQGAKTSPIFLPRTFRETIERIREMHESPSLNRLKLELRKARDRLEIEG